MLHLRNLLFLALAFICFTGLQAQNTRYIDELFPAVHVEYNLVYATNISTLTMQHGDPDTIPLVMDIYTPIGDTQNERPTVIYIPGGNFLPQYFNGRVTGEKSDSTVVEVCTRLARRGYTAVAITHRQGWNPLASNGSVRTATFLQAYYRGIQDARACVRFLRKTTEEGNPFAVDSDRIVAWGQATGGYLSLAMATLDDYAEISSSSKFINSETLMPHVPVSLYGDIYGEESAPFNLPNTPGYSSAIQLAVTMGGAIGDTSWIDGNAATTVEPPIIGYHVLTDPWIPFGDGPVLTPHPPEIILPVAGTRLVVQVANEKGTNDPANPINGQMAGLAALLEARTEEQASIPVHLFNLNQAPTTLATPHMYPFLTYHDTGALRFESGPWEWWNKAQLETTIAQVNTEFGTNLSADNLHTNDSIIHPEMSATKARAYLDTVFTHFLPRACQVLQLEECAIVGTQELLDHHLVSVRVGPNPASERIFVRSAVSHPMKTIQLFDYNGYYLRTYDNINHDQYEIERDNLPAGIYLLKVKFAEGISVHRIIFQ